MARILHKELAFHVGAESARLAIVEITFSEVYYVVPLAQSWLEKVGSSGVGGLAGLVLVVGKACVRRAARG